MRLVHTSSGSSSFSALSVTTPAVGHCTSPMDVALGIVDKVAVEGVNIYSEAGVFTGVRSSYP